MLPLVLGGIALAAVGYGVKEYCELEGCPWDGKPYRDCDEEATISHENIFMTIEKNKHILYETLENKLKVAIVAIAPKKEEKLTVLEKMHYEYFVYTQMPEDVALYAKQYRTLIENTLEKVDSISESLEVLQEKELSYKQLDKEEKYKVKEAITLFNLSCEILTLRLTEGETLNIEAIALLKRLQVQLDMVLK